MKTEKNTNVLELIKSIAKTLADPEEVIRIVYHEDNKHEGLRTGLQLWDDISLAGGSSGLILLFSALDTLFPGEKWDESAHKYILKIKTYLESGKWYNNLSLYGGISGVCFAVDMASKGGQRYARFLEQLEQLLLNSFQKQYLEPILSYFDQHKPVPPSLYDLISGIAGAGLYLLKKQEKPGFEELIKKIINTLLRLTKPLTVQGYEVPGWFISQEDQFNEQDKAHYSEGCFNVGLAHGIPSILGFLSLCYLHGFQEPKLKQTIEILTKWVISKRTQSKMGFSWPTAVPFLEEIGSKPSTDFHTRDAWCYGAPGVIMSLILASKVLNKKEISSIILPSVHSIIQRPREHRGLPGPMVCHGIAGLLMIIHQIAESTQDSLCLSFIQELKTKLLSYYSEEHPFGFKDYDPTGRGYYKLLDRPGLLEGSSGPLLTLLSVETGFSKWQLPFLTLASF